MKAKITNELIKTLKPANKPYDVRDESQKGFIVRVNPSGKMVYMCEYARAKRIMVGRVKITHISDARRLAETVMTDVMKGIDPRIKRRDVKGYESLDPSSLNLNEFITLHYKSWVESNNPSGQETVKMLENRFCKDKKFQNKPLKSITLALLEEWCTERRKQVSAETINRNVAALRSALNKAVEWKLLEYNDTNKIKPLKTKDDPIVRYLSQQEELALRNELQVRNEELRKEVPQRKEAYKNTITVNNKNILQVTYCDYLYPMILLSINTGIRRGELFRLTWDDILFDLKSLRAKSRKTKRNEYKIRYVPLNSEAFAALKAWYEQHPSKKGLVFINEETGKAFTTIKKTWSTLRNEIKLKDFRWHDFRHHFASQLVMAGVDLNTVRELMGHTDIKMTLKYAHLAPEHKAEAVERIANLYEKYQPPQ